MSTFQWLVVSQKLLSLHPLGVRDSMNCQFEVMQTHHPYPQSKDADLHYPSDMYLIWDQLFWCLICCPNGHLKLFWIVLILHMFFRTIQKKKSLDEKRSRCLSADRVLRQMEYIDIIASCSMCRPGLISALILVSESRDGLAGCRLAIRQAHVLANTAPRPCVHQATLTGTWLCGNGSRKNVAILILSTSVHIIPGNLQFWAFNSQDQNRSIPHHSVQVLRIDLAELNHD